VCAVTGKKQSHKIEEISAYDSNFSIDYDVSYA